MKPRISATAWHLLRNIDIPEHERRIVQTVAERNHDESVAPPSSNGRTWRDGVLHERAD